MENSLIFVIVVMGYFCILFPLQMRYYIRRRQRLALLHRQQNDSSFTRTTYINTTDSSNSTANPSRQRTTINDYSFLFGATRIPTPVSSPDLIERNENIEAARRHQEMEHRQQLIDIQREVEEQARRRREERLALGASPHMPIRLINSSTVRSPIYTINTSGNTTGVSNSSINYPYGPPMTPDSDGPFIHVPGRTISKDDELPSYDQAVAFNSTSSLTAQRY